MLTFYDTTLVKFQNALADEMLDEMGKHRDALKEENDRKFISL